MILTVRWSQSASNALVCLVQPCLNAKVLVAVPSVFEVQHDELITVHTLSLLKGIDMMVEGKFPLCSLRVPSHRALRLNMVSKCEEKYVYMKDKSIMWKAILKLLLL